MLGHNHYYHGIIRKIVVLFGHLFEGLKIERTNAAGEVEQIITVPISYGPKEKWLARLNEQGDLTKRTAMFLPRIGFEITGMQYDPSRKIQSLNLVRADNTTTTKEVDATFAPVPYDLTMSMVIVTKTPSDALQIVEQILPFFTPQFTATIEVVPEVGINQDIPITLVDVNFTDSYEGSFDDRREVIYNLTFNIKCNLFGPVTKYGTILQTIMHIDPEYGEVTRRATSTANQLIDGSWEVNDAIIDINRDPTIY